jgi:hypothetical protein
MDLNKREVTVIIPPNVREGQKFKVNLRQYNVAVNVKCPVGKSSGMPHRFRIALSPENIAFEAAYLRANQAPNVAPPNVRQNVQPPYRASEMASRFTSSLHSANRYVPYPSPSTIQSRYASIPSQAFSLPGVNKPPVNPSNQFPHSGLLLPQSSIQFPPQYFLNANHMLTPSLTSHDALAVVDPERVHIEDEFEEAADDHSFRDYQPKFYKGGNPHPDQLVESSSLSAVPPPHITYELSLPKQVQSHFPSTDHPSTVSFE